MYHRFGYGVVTALFALSGFLGGCGGTEEAKCSPENEIHGVCAGVPPNPVCEADSCVDGVSCAKTVEASDDAELASAIAGAAPGTCIVLESGAYKAANLPGGVSLLGRSADDVTVGKVVLGDGAGAVLRGLTVGTGGLKVAGAKGARIESVRVSKAVDLGVEVTAGSTVTIVTSTFQGSGRYNLDLSDGAEATIDKSILSGAIGPGIWAACSTDCACTAQPKLTMTNSIVRDNHIGGVVLFGATASFNQVDIVRTMQGDMGKYFGMGGGGLSVGQCSKVTASGLRVEGNESFGVMVDNASAALGSEGSPGGVTLKENVVGLWVNNIPGTEQVSLVGATVEGNQGVGVGVSGDTHGFILCKSLISTTANKTLPVYKNGVEGFSKDVGDGLSWLGKSEALISDVTLRGNARTSILIDGEAFGSMMNITLEGGDEAKGILQQNFLNGAQPTVGAGAPALSTNSGEVFEVPVAPKPISRSL